nr:unnamed protein product [Callosobruchus chinensis]
MINREMRPMIRQLHHSLLKECCGHSSGCGLLSLIASKDPEACVVAVEENKVLAKMCKDILAENNVKNVKVMNCHSTDIKDPVDKCNLIVTETFDVALFGERVLESIHHALSTLKTEEDFKIVPARAKVYITGRISSPELHSKYQYIPKPCLERLQLDDICLSHREWEPYEAEYLTERKYDKFSDQQQVYNLLNAKDEHQVIDFNTFPLVGLLLAKKGCQVYHMINNEGDRTFLSTLFALTQYHQTDF